MLTLRPYQEEIIRQTVQSIRGGFRAPLVVAPTGSGKTVIFAHMATGAVKKGKRVLILTHRREILQQTVSKLDEFGVQAGRIVSGHPMTPELIQVAMVATLVHRLESTPKPDLIIIDECQHSISQTWRKTIDHFGGTLRIGYTATPERLSGEGLIELFDTIIHGPTAQELVTQGYLSTPRMFCGPNIQQKSNLKVTAGDYDKKEQAKKMTERVIIGDVIQHYRERLHGLPAVCFCVSIDHCHRMESEFLAAGFRARTVHGKMGRADRDAAIIGLGDGSVQVLCSCDVISEGVDIPVIAGAILLRRTKSLALYLQQVGRALRPYPGKPEAIILDHSGCIYDHGHVLDNRAWTLEAKKRSQRGGMALPPVTVCPGCTGVWPGLPATCPDCGYNLQEMRDRSEGRKPPREIEGILREVMPDAGDEHVMALTDEVLLLQRVPAGDRLNRMRAAVRKYGYSDRNRALAAAIGYKDNWVRYETYRGRRR